MHYITTINKLAAISKKVKSTDLVTVLIQEDTLSVDVLNTFMSFKAKIEVKKIEDEADHAAVVGYFLGKEGKGVSIETGIKIPKALEEYIGAKKKVTPKKASPQKPTAKKAASKPQKAEDPENINIKGQLTIGDIAKDKKTEIPHKTGPAAKTVKSSKAVKPAAKAVSKASSPAKGKTSVKALEKVKSDKDAASKRKRRTSAEKAADDAIKAIAKHRKEKEADVKKIILSCFRFEDTVDDAMAAVKKKDFAAEDIKLIVASGEQFLAEANEG